MTEDIPPATGRSADDKERARQQSRAIDARPAAKEAASRPTKGRPADKKTGPSPGARKPQSGQGRNAPAGNRGKRAASPPAGKGSGGRGQPAARKPSPGRPGRPAPRSAPRRPPTTLLTYGVVGLVLVVVVVLVIIKVTGGSSSGNSSGPPAQPAPAALVQQVTHIPASVYNTVGVDAASQVTPPKAVQNASPLQFDGKPGIFAMLAEYCPYCAAERWAILAGFSRFGSFSGLKTMQSSSTDIYPNTQTFSFAGATFTSPYVSFQPKEVESNQLNAAGTNYLALESLTKQEEELAAKYDNSTYFGSSTSTGSIPFMDIGNKFLTSGASYSPSILQGLTREQIAGDLSDPKNPVTQDIITMANYLSAATCSIDGQKPGSVCTSSGVKAADKVLGLNG